MAVAVDHFENGRNIVSGASANLEHLGGALQTTEKVLKNRGMDTTKPGVNLRDLIVVNFHL